MGPQLGGVERFDEVAEMCTESANADNVVLIVTF